MPWKSSDREYCNDQTGKSFVFSLTNNHKFIDKTMQNTMICNKKSGPAFGKKHVDLTIGD